MKRRDFVRLIYSGEDFVAKKSTQLYRSTTNSNETIIGKKYVSPRERDRAIYEGWVYNNNVIDNNLPDAFVDTYETNRNISVAGTKTQAKILQEIYEKNSITNPTVKSYIEKGLVNPEKLSKSIDEMSSDELDSYLYYNPYEHDFDILNKPMSNPDTKQYMDTLAKKGYDAVVDMYDVSISFSEGPMVILKSEDTLRKKKSESIADKWGVK